MKLLILIYTFIFSFASQALPGVSEVFDKYQAENNALSETDINCNQQRENKSLEDLMANVQKLDCNSIKDPLEFCKCQEMVSKNSTSDSTLPKEEVQKVLIKAISKNYENLLREKISNIANIKELSNAIGEVGIDNSCLVQGDENDTFRKMEELQKKDSSHLSIGDRVKLSLFEDINNKLNLSPRLPDSSKVHDYISKVLASDSPISEVEDIDWGKFSSSPLLDLVSKSNGSKEIFNDHIIDSRNRNMFRNDFISLEKLPNTNMNYVEIEMSSEVLDGQIRQNERFASEVINHECHKVRKELKDILSININAELSTLQDECYAIDSEVSGDSILFVNSLFKKEIGKEKNISYRYRALAGLDNLYCSKLKERLNLSENDDFNNLSVSLTKYLSDVSLEIENEKKLYQDSVTKSEELRKQKKNIEADLISSQSKLELSKLISKGQFRKNVNGKEFFDSSDKRVTDLLKNCKDMQCVSLKAVIQQGVNIPYAKILKYSNEGLKKKLIKDIADLKETSTSIDVALSKAKEEINLHAGKIKSLTSDKKSFESYVHKQFGSAGLNHIRSTAHAKVVKESGTNSLLSRYEIFESEHSRRGRIRNDIAKEIHDITKNGSDVAVKSERSISPIQNVERSVQKAIEPNRIRSSVSSYFDDDLMEKRHVINTNNVTTSKLDTQSLEGARRLEELESTLSKLKSSIDGESTEENPASIEDKRIAEIKQEIEIQKIKNEKKKVQMELAKVKTTSSSKEQAEVLPKDLSKPIVSSARSGEVSTVSSLPVSSVNAPQGRSYSRGVSSSGIAPVAVQGGSQSQSESINTGEKSSVASSTRNVGKSISRGLSLTSKSDVEYAISESFNLQDHENSRLVKIDFKIESIPSEQREEFLKSLFIEGEEVIVLELPGGEKLLVENRSKEEKKDNGKGQKEKRNRMKYEDLKKVLKVGTYDGF